MHYDVAAQELSWTNAPSEFADSHDNFSLVTTEDGNLGFVSYAGGRIRMYMWTRVFGADGAAEWAQRIAIHELLPTHALPDRYSVVGFIDGGFCWKHALSC